ncbi:hypothetical protein DPMN_015157 [Dreissena polymorpha]|uniref:Uncharacterized protein n=1 Tax=Dreissena polymorpha TaxID=45954 RepID=A0A9D4NAK7_DREPO|nr:hypothetical protein DPMN_015157 [Dreissena polymorpha]
MFLRDIKIPKFTCDGVSSYQSHKTSMHINAVWSGDALLCGLINGQHCANSQADLEPRWPHMAKDARYFALIMKENAATPSSCFLSVLRENSPNVNTAVCEATQIQLPDSSVEVIVIHWYG